MSRSAVLLFFCICVHLVSSLSLGGAVALVVNTGLTICGLPSEEIEAVVCPLVQEEGYLPSFLEGWVDYHARVRCKIDSIETISRPFLDSICPVELNEHTQCCDHIIVNSSTPSTDEIFMEIQPAGDMWMQEYHLIGVETPDIFPTPYTTLNYTTILEPPIPSFYPNMTMVVLIELAFLVWTAFHVSNKVANLLLQSSKPTYQESLQQVLLSAHSHSKAKIQKELNKMKQDLEYEKQMRADAENTQKMLQAQLCEIFALVLDEEEESAHMDEEGVAMYQIESELGKLVELKRKIKQDRINFREKIGQIEELLDQKVNAEEEVVELTKQLRKAEEEREELAEEAAEMGAKARRMEEEMARKIEEARKIDREIGRKAEIEGEAERLQSMQSTKKYEMHSATVTCNENMKINELTAALEEEREKYKDQVNKITALEGDFHAQMKREAQRSSVNYFFLFMALDSTIKKNRALKAEQWNTQQLIAEKEAKIMAVMESIIKWKAEWRKLTARSPLVNICMFSQSQEKNHGAEVTSEREEEVEKEKDGTSVSSGSARA